MFSIAVGEFTLICHDGEFGNDLQHARLVEEFDQEGDQTEKCCFAVKRGQDFPFLVVTQYYKRPFAFAPAALLVPETRLLFLGVGERLLAYELDGPTRIWEDMTDCGFWGWARHGDFIVMSAELEMAAWDIHGTKRWATFVETPWEYSVAEGIVHLNVMDRLSNFALDTGPRR
jgi:hypothetical protein